MAEVLAVPGYDEQRVVDAHGEADHDRQGWRGLREVDHGREDADAADADAKTQQGREDGDAHRQHGSERHQQDHHRHQQAQQFRGRRLLRLPWDDLAAELHGHAGASGRLGRFEDPVEGLFVDVEGAVGVAQLAQGDGPVLGDLPRI